MKKKIVASLLVLVACSCVVRGSTNIVVATPNSVSNQVRTALSPAQFNTNTFPYTITNLFGINAATAPNLVPVIYQKVVGTNVVTNTITLVSGLTNVDGLYRVSIWQSVTNASTNGTFTSNLIWSDENGNHTNTLTSLVVTNLNIQSTNFYLHATTNLISHTYVLSGTTNPPGYSIYTIVETLH